MQICYHWETKGEDFYSFPPSRALLPTLLLLANTWSEGEQGFIQLKENNTTSLHYIHVSKSVIRSRSRLRLFPFLKMFRLHLSLLVTCLVTFFFFFLANGREACLIKVWDTTGPSDGGEKSEIWRCLKIKHGSKEWLYFMNRKEAT